MSDEVDQNLRGPAEQAEHALSEQEKRRRSFERSLAGPSVGKAGLVRDQTEINRVIADASKVRLLRSRGRQRKRLHTDPYDRTPGTTNSVGLQVLPESSPQGQGIDGKDRLVQE